MSDLLNALARTLMAPPNALTEAVERRRREECEFIDLVTPALPENGLGFPPDVLRRAVQQAIDSPTVHRYAPDPRGQLPARDAVADWYTKRGAPTTAEQVILTAGTSLGYLHCLQLLTRLGDEVLTPRPGYPLLSEFCRMMGLRERHYHLREGTEGWTLDPEEVRFQVTPRTRVVLLVSPHNPTGHVASEALLAGLGAICREHRLALLFDEVFGETFAQGPLPRPAATLGFPLAITLNGLSKMLNLPGWKVAWMRVDGEAGEREAFLRSMEHLADTFLSVNELAQTMVPVLLSGTAQEFGAWMASEIRGRLCFARAALALPSAMPHGGVYLCPRLPAGTIEDEAAALALLERQGILVHPGYYYGLDSHLVMTCLAAPMVIATGLERLATWAAGEGFGACGGTSVGDSC